MSDIVFVMGARNVYVEFLTEHFSPLGVITARAMFGGYCLYCDGGIFGIVAGKVLYLKADEVNRARFVERGMRAFKPFADRDEVMSYHEAPPEVFEDHDAMKDWVGSAISAGRRGGQSRRPRARKRPVR